MPIHFDVHRLKQRRTKIVATLGPASRDRETLSALIAAGVDVFRLNFSHGTHEEHRATCEQVRAASEEVGVSVAILGDLCGPKIRTGPFAGGGVDLPTGGQVTVTVRDVEGGPGLIPSAYAALADDVGPGDRILLDDGNMELRVEEVTAPDIRCSVVAGGFLKDRKGMNLPGVRVSASSLTDKDREDAAFALGLGVDFLALSFVRSASDVEELRAITRGLAPGTQIVAKIEKPEALNDIDGILAASDAIMVARGDLGVELPAEVVPIVQTQLVDRARAAGKPVIVATQMLESMVDRPRPTRAEVTDVSNAVRSGADAVMLSAETAAGAHPVAAVQIMDQVARETEGYLWGQGGFGTLTAASRSAGAFGLPALPAALDLRDAISRATAGLSRELMVRAIVVFTRSGWSAGMVAASRPQAPVLAVTPEAATHRRLNLLWGVVPVRSDPDLTDTDDLHEEARRLARQAGLADPGDSILRVWGFNLDPERNAPTIAVLTV